MKRRKLIAYVRIALQVVNIVWSVAVVAWSVTLLLAVAKIADTKTAMPDHLFQVVVLITLMFVISSSRMPELSEDTEADDPPPEREDVPEQAAQPIDLKARRAA